MRITKNQLRRIIKEELAGVLREDDLEEGFFSKEEPRSQSEIQADIDKANADLKSNKISTAKATELLAGYTREQKKAGRDPHKTGKALTGTGAFPGK